MVEPNKPEAAAESCQRNDLVSQKSGLLLWCLPTLAIFLGLTWNVARPWLWIPALSVMGIGCVVNAKRCGRLHCYITGPIFLLAAVYVILAEVKLVSLRPDIFIAVVLGGAALACLAELPFGRYASKT